MKKNWVTDSLKVLSPDGHLPLCILYAQETGRPREILYTLVHPAAMTDKEARDHLRQFLGYPWPDAGEERVQ